MASESLHGILDSNDETIYQIRSKASGPAGSLPLTDEMLRHWPSGDLFGLTQNAGMGWDPRQMLGPQFLLLSTQGGLRAPDGSPIALGFHTGHWEVGLLVEAAAVEIKQAGGVPFAAYCSDPCDGRTQGTVGMFDSLAYRNDAATVMRRQIRSLPTRRGVLGVATCDKGLPAMMMALAGSRDLPCVLVPGGVTLPPEEGEDTAQVQTIGARFVQGKISLEDAARAGCAACGSPGGGCQFLGTAATSQVIGEALGLSLPHSALAPSGEPIWRDMGRRSARALWHLHERGITVADVVTDASVRNAMVVHAACGGSTNLLLHLPAIAFAAGLRRPTVQDWSEVNRAVPRFVDVLPNGPVNHPTVRVFLAGGVPEIMLHLREMELLDLSVLTVTGDTLGKSLEYWETSERRARLRETLRRQDDIDPDDVIIPPAEARARHDQYGLLSGWEPVPGRLGHQGHVDRPWRRGLGRRLPDDGACPRVHFRAGCYRSRERPNRPARPAWRRVGADGPRSVGLGDGRDLSNHIGTEVSCLGKGRRGRDRREVFGCQHRSLYRPRRPGSVGRRSDWQGPRR